MRNFLPFPKTGCKLPSLWKCAFGELVESLSSCPAIADNINAVSSTVLAIGPGVSRLEANATQPQREHKPYVGFIPTKLQKLAGCLIEPPVSLPVAARHIFEATAQAEPPEEPPGTKSRLSLFALYGFIVGPK